MKLRRPLIGLVAVALLVIFAAVRFDITGHCEGIFFLKGGKGALAVVKDDLYLGDGHNLLWGLDFHDPRFWFSRKLRGTSHNAPYLAEEWFEKDGVGFVRNYLPGGGRQMLTCFSRFIDDGGGHSSGLFVGGGLPGNVEDDNSVKTNETGMAYFDGKRWYHIWCNSNEAIASSAQRRNIYPSQWKFLGSRVLNRSDNTLTIVSSHQVNVDSVPLRIDRIADFKAGDTFFTLSFRIRNVGNSPVGYYYLYGDEPWLGNFGTSGGNVGWVKDRLIKYVERLDTTKYTYAGFFDYGNDLIGQPHSFTNVANFLEWKSVVKPLVYFSNGPEEHAPATPAKEPLSSDERFIAVQWGPVFLEPGQSDYYSLTIGMAGVNPQTGVPEKPRTYLYSH